MINDFTFYNPTRIHFGRGALDKLSEELAAFGPTVLLLYGRGSVKKHGLYDRVLAILKDCGKTVVELGGIKPNPSYAQLLEGVRLVREHKADLILAVGGGSVIDCAKGISASVWCPEDPWKRFYLNQLPLEDPAVPVGAVLTMAGTASEMNSGSVITNEDEKIKMGRVFPASVNPVFSILNPEYTYTVPKSQMTSGIFDCLSHLMEQYFSGEDDNTTDYVIEGVMLSLIASARKALINPQDYEARSNIMWCATLGLNDVTGVSKTQDWEVHMIEHQVGAYTDCPHGAGLAAVSPAYYRFVAPYGLPKFARFSKRVWGIDTSGMSDAEAAEAGIRALESFIAELGLPSTLRELGTTEDMLPAIAATTVLCGGYKQLTNEDVLSVLKACF